MHVMIAKAAQRTSSRGSKSIGLSCIAMALIIAGCERPITGPLERSGPDLEPAAVVLTPGLSVYTDRASWEAAVVAAGGAVQNMDFTGLTLGRVTQLDTDYGAFRIVVDDVAASSFSNPGINVFPDASCSLGSGDCEVFTFNLLDPASAFDGPKINQLIFPQNVIAFGGDFIQVGITVPPPGSTTGPVTLQIGTETVVINPYLDAGGNGFFGLVATASNTVSFTFVKSGTIQNDIFNVYNPAYANAPASATPAQMIMDLRDVIAGFTLANGIANSFDAKLKAASEALGAGEGALACSSLQDLINQVNALSGRKISAGDAAMVVARTMDIRNALGC